MNSSSHLKSHSRKKPLSASDLKRTLESLGTASKSAVLARFFKTGPGEYAEGDHFLGIAVPKIRLAIRDYLHLSLSEIKSIIRSPYHEIRLAAVLLLVAQFQKGDSKLQSRIYHFYIKFGAWINNWDLIDLSAPIILGKYLENRSKEILIEWARSNHLWARRKSMLATFYGIRKNSFQDALRIATILRHDKHDLIQKAVGWMLREIGKRNLEVEEAFLDRYSKTLPRTMLRYAIERFPETKRLAYLRKV